MPTPRRPLAGATAVALLVTSSWLTGCQPATPPGGAATSNGTAQTGGTASAFHATEVSGIDYGRGLVLTDTAGQPRRLEDFEGSVAVWFFGFANCPDICPTTLLRLQEVRKALGADAAKVQVVFVTLDPERDTADKLRAYVGQFDASFIGLRPEPSQMAELQKSFRVIAARLPMPGTDAYMVDHSAVIYVYDRSTALRLIAAPDFKVPELAADLAKLVKG